MWFNLPGNSWHGTERWSYWKLLVLVLLYEHLGLNYIPVKYHLQMWLLIYMFVCFYLSETNSNSRKDEGQWWTLQLSFNLLFSFFTWLGLRFPVLKGPSHSIGSSEASLWRAGCCVSPGFLRLKPDSKMYFKATPPTKKPTAMQCENIIQSYSNYLHSVVMVY